RSPAHPLPRLDPKRRRRRRRANRAAARRARPPTLLPLPPPPRPDVLGRQPADPRVHGAMRAARAPAPRLRRGFHRAAVAEPGSGGQFHHDDARGAVDARRGRAWTAVQYAAEGCRGGRGGCDYCGSGGAGGAGGGEEDGRVEVSAGG
ncbi:hypothetical protein LTR91_027097, partial [Friedmanniomyces endolithicus]